MLTSEALGSALKLRALRLRLRSHTHRRHFAPSRARVDGASFWYLTCNYSNEQEPVLSCVRANGTLGYRETNPAHGLVCARNTSLSMRQEPARFVFLSRFQPAEAFASGFWHGYCEHGSCSHTMYVWEQEPLSRGSMVAVSAQNQLMFLSRPLSGELRARAMIIRQNCFREGPESFDALLSRPR